MAIARAYMREAEVLILDEPTAALDARAEFEVFQRFKELSEGKTAVLISHRFSSVRMADRILVLADGKVEAAGTHEELVSKPGAMPSCSSCRPRATDDRSQDQTLQLSVLAHRTFPDMLGAYNAPGVHFRPAGFTSRG